MGNTKNKRVEDNFSTHPRLWKNRAKNPKTKKINTSTANHKQKKTTKPSTNKEERLERTPRRPLMMRCTVPTGSHCTLKQRKWPAAHVLAAATLMALGPQPECHPVPCQAPQ